MEGLSADPLSMLPLIERAQRLGVTDARVLGAMTHLSRGAFLNDPASEPLAFADAVVPIPCGQVMLRPVTTAHLVQAMALPGDDSARVLLVGFGSGYMAAMIAALCKRVYAVDRFATLIRAGEARLSRDGISNVELRHGDGLLGWPEMAPFDRIVLAGSVLQVPQALTNQLAPHGRLTAPVMTPGGGAVLTAGWDGKVDRYPFIPPIPGLVSGVAQAL